MKKIFGLLLSGFWLMSLHFGVGGCVYSRDKIDEEVLTGGEGQGIQTPTSPEGEVIGTGGEATGGTTTSGEVAIGGEATGATTGSTATGTTGGTTTGGTATTGTGTAGSGTVTAGTTTTGGTTGTAGTATAGTSGGTTGGTTGPTGAQPKRFTPPNCQNYQYAFVSAYDPVTKQAGAENVYAVPCSDDGLTNPPVKLTTNTDWSSHYKEIKFRPDGAQVAYRFGPGFPYPGYIFLDGTVAGSPQYQIFTGGPDVGGAFSVFSPTWLDNEKIGYARIDPNNDYQLAWQYPNDSDHPVPFSGLPTREIQSATWVPALGAWILSQKDIDGKFKLYVAKEGDPVRAILTFAGGSYAPTEGEDPSANLAAGYASGGLAYVSGNYVTHCALNVPAREVGNEWVYVCAGIHYMGGDDNNPASSPCWSADGKYLYYEIYSSGVSSIGRVDVNGLMQNQPNASVILDEFPGNAGSEMIPGCYPIMNP